MMSADVVEIRKADDNCSSISGNGWRFSNPILLTKQVPGRSETHCKSCTPCLLQSATSHTRLSSVTALA